MTELLTGGCQCGAIRYRLDAALERPHVCHCRMCQKASGNYFMPLAGIDNESFVVTRGEIAWFFSSEPVRRGFCSACGTPLLIDTVADPKVHLMLGTLDDPTRIEPEYQYGIEAKMPWLERIAGLPATTTEGDVEEDQEFITSIRESNHQHPDHETEDWLPGKRGPVRGGAW